MAKAIPTIERQAAGPVKAPEPAPASSAGPTVVVDNGLPCTGRCGHCDCHPCQLHAPI